MEETGKAWGSKREGSPGVRRKFTGDLCLAELSSEGLPTCLHPGKQEAYGPALLASLGYQLPQASVLSPVWLLHGFQPTSHLRSNRAEGPRPSFLFVVLPGVRSWGLAHARQGLCLRAARPVPPSLLTSGI
jgi:hypothetical protein